MKSTDFFSIIEPLALIKMLPRPHITILCHLLVLLINKCRGPFFLPHRTKPKASDFALRAQSTQGPVVYGSRKNMRGIGPSIRPKTQAGPLNPKYMSAAMVRGPPEQSKKGGKTLTRTIQKERENQPPPPPPHPLFLSFFFLCG